MIAVGYTRLSQDGREGSIESQKQDIRDYCNRVGFDLETIYDDGRYASGFSTEDREEYLKLRNRIEMGDVDAVIVRDGSRIGRDFDERMEFIISLRRTDTQLHSADKAKIDLSDPMDAAMEGFRAASDDQTKSKEIRHAVRAVKEKVAAGQAHGRPPFGFRYSRDKTEWVPDGEQFIAGVEAIHRSEVKDESYRSIAGDLPPSRTTVSRIAKEPGRFLDALDGVEEPEDITSALLDNLRDEVPDD